VPIITINKTVACKQIPEIEHRHGIRLMKEQGQGILNTLPYKKIPQLMLIELIYHVVLWPNASPVKSGVLKTLLVSRNSISPQTSRVGIEIFGYFFPVYSIFYYCNLLIYR
jgi:hypothetical protein